MGVGYQDQLPLSGLLLATSEQLHCSLIFLFIASYMVETGNKYATQHSKGWFIDVVTICRVEGLGSCGTGYSLTKGGRGKRHS